MTAGVQFAVDPTQRRHGHHRDEPARVAVERAREQGDRVPDREDRGEARGRLPRSTRSRNDITRETPASFEPTIDYVVTKIPRWAFEKLPGRDAGARHADAVGRRGDGDRPHVPRVAAEGAALARDRSPRPQLRPGRARARRPSTTTSSCARAAIPTPERLFQLEAALRRGRVDRAAARGHRRSTRGSSTRSLQIVEERDRLAATSAPAALDRRRLAPGQAARLLRRASSRTSGTSTERRRARRAARGRRRVTYKTVDTCAAEFAAHTPYHYGTYEDEDEVAPLDAARGRDPRQRPEPHRPGRRVRLLLRARRVRALATPASRP